MTLAECKGGFIKKWGRFKKRIRPQKFFANPPLQRHGEYDIIQMLTREKVIRKANEPIKPKQMVL